MGAGGNKDALLETKALPYWPRVNSAIVSMETDSRAMASRVAKFTCKGGVANESQNGKWDRKDRPYDFFAGEVHSMKMNFLLHFLALLSNVTDGIKCRVF